MPAKRRSAAVRSKALTKRRDIITTSILPSSTHGAHQLAGTAKAKNGQHHTTVGSSSPYIFDPLNGRLFYSYTAITKANSTVNYVTSLIKLSVLQREYATLKSTLESPSERERAMADFKASFFDVTRAPAVGNNGKVDPPAYTRTERITFPVGGKDASPFVTAIQLKAHLALLHEFSELKQQIVQGRASNSLLTQKDPERRWAWFVGLAIERCVLCTKQSQ